MKQQKFETETFQRLKKSKRNRIIRIAMREFSEYGFKNASTNRIVKRAGISKGSLFKYFTNKENLFYYILHEVMIKLTLELNKTSLPKDIIDRIDSILDFGFDFYEKNPELYRFMISITSGDNQEILQKVMSKFSQKDNQGMNLFLNFYSDIDTENLRFTKEEFLPALYWIISGIKLSIHSQMTQSDLDIKNLRKVYKEKFKILKEILRNGIYKKQGV